MPNSKSKSVSQGGITRNSVDQYKFHCCDSLAAWKLTGVCLITFIGLAFLCIKQILSLYWSIFLIIAVIVSALIFLYQRKYILREVKAIFDGNSIKLLFDDQSVINLNLPDVLSYKVYNYPFNQYNLWLYGPRGASTVGTGLVIKFKNDSAPLRLHASSPYCNPTGLKRFCNAFEKMVIKYNESTEVKVKRTKSIIAYPLAKWVLWAMTVMVIFKFIIDITLKKDIPRSFYGAIASLAGLWMWRAESDKKEFQYQRTVKRVSGKIQSEETK